MHRCLPSLCRNLPKDGYLNGYPQFRQCDPTSLNFYRRRYRGIGRASSLSTNTEPCGGRPQSEAWHDIKWFRKFVGLSLDYVTVPKAMVSKFVTAQVGWTVHESRSD